MTKGDENLQLKKIAFLSALITACALPTDAALTDAYVIPSGMCAGVKLYSDGLTVAGTAPVLNENGKEINPAQDSGIKKGDIIKSADGVVLDNIEMLSEQINNSSDTISLDIVRGNQNLTLSITPVQTSDAGKKIGLWVRDSTAGIGTVTYFDPNNNSFAALGHGICDVDTGNILTVKSGNILHCSLMSIQKSEKGSPGELDGTFEYPEIADISLNTPSGIYGKVCENEMPEAKPVRAASRSEVHEGEAYILTDAASSKTEAYTAQIVKVDENSTDSKGLVVKITDERLLSSTGGIVRGMSGAPIMQDGLLAGAVTHVFVNDPSKGYGILAENMLNISSQIQ